MSALSLRHYARATRFWSDGDCEAWCIPFEAVPVPFGSRNSARTMLNRLVQCLETTARLAPEYFLQFNHVHHENASSRLSESGRSWLPHLGLGVWPDREPPTLWTEEEFYNLAPGEIVRPLMDQVFRIGGPPPARHDAMNSMFGLGAGLLFLLPQGDTAFLKRTTQTLLPRIKEPSFRAYEFYVPLLEAKSISGVSRATLEEWLCGAQVCIRESAEDKALLILSSMPLVTAWKALAMEMAESETEWRLIE